jgi:Flp pilus assembly pilin Flp
MTGQKRHGTPPPQYHPFCVEGTSMQMLRKLWLEDEGQDIAEYAVMLAVILVIVVGTVKLIGGKSNNIFSEVSSSIG